MQQGWPPSQLRWGRNFSPSLAHCMLLHCVVHARAAAMPRQPTASLLARTHRTGAAATGVAGAAPVGGLDPRPHRVRHTPHCQVLRHCTGVGGGARESVCACGWGWGWREEPQGPQAIAGCWWLVGEGRPWCAGCGASSPARC